MQLFVLQVSDMSAPRVDRQVTAARLVESCVPVSLCAIVLFYYKLGRGL